MIQYDIIRSSRKTLNITIERNRKVVVHSPMSLTDSQIAVLVEKKRNLIIKKLNNPYKYPQEPQPKEFVSGEGLLYLGKLYRLQISEVQFDGVIFENNIFGISKNSQATAHQVFKTWYIQQARTVITPVAADFAKRLGVCFNQCKISDMKYRWGSCTPKGNLNFNWRIIKAPINVINYIVVHELTHLREPNHTPEFWNIVSIQVPDYQRAKDWLKANGNQMEIDF